MIREVTLGVAITDEAQQCALDQGYKLQPYEGHFRRRYVMGVRPWRYVCKFDQIVAKAVDVFGIERRHILGRSQRAIYVLPRHAVMWALCDVGFSTSKIGNWMDRDHTTVISGRRRCEDIQSRDMGYRRACERLLESVDTRPAMPQTGETNL